MHGQSMRKSLKQAFVDALNQLTGGSETYLSILQENMTEVIEMEQSNLPEEIQRKSDVLQKKLIECAERHEDYEEIAQEIFRLARAKGTGFKGKCFSTGAERPYAGTAGIFGCSAASHYRI